MADIKDIKKVLNFDFRATYYSQNAENLLDDKVVKANIARIHDITSKLENTDAEISGRYNNIKSNIYLDIAREFKDNLSAWNAVVDSTELSVRFSTNEGVDTKASYFVSGCSLPSQ